MRPALLAVLAACGDSPAQAIDAAIDADPCTQNNVVRMTGTLLDWDSGVPATGIEGASVMVAGDPTRTATTAADGTFALCLTDDPMTTVELAVPGHVGGTAIVLKEVATSGDFALRTFTPARGADFNYDPAKAQVFVHVVGDERTVDVSAPHDPAMQFKDPDWVESDTGHDLFMPNVDLNGGSAKLVADNASMVGTIPLVAGAFTFVVIASL